jgi:hypothetical protein
MIDGVALVRGRGGVERETIALASNSVEKQ